MSMSRSRSRSRSASRLLPGRALLAAVIACMLYVASPAQADVIYVGRPEHWLKVQDSFQFGPTFETVAQALKRAADGDTIILLKDVDEAVVIDKSISLLGYGQRVRPKLSKRLVVKADGVLLDRLHFTGIVGTAVTFERVSAGRMTRCFVTECTNGVFLYDSTECVLENNRLLFAGNSILMRGGGRHLARKNLVDSGGFYAVTLDASPDNRLVDNIVRRSGWTGILIHSRSDRTQLIGNVVEGSDIGISIQTDANLLRDNLLFDSHHGVVLARSPLGKDPSVHDHIAYLDSDTNDTDVICSDNVIEDNVFRGARRDAILLKQAAGNILRGNRITGGKLHGIVLMSAANDNLVVDNTIGPHPGAAVCVVDSRGNKLTDNRLAADGAAVRLVNAPDNIVDAAHIVRLADGELLQNPQPAPDGSAYDIVWGDFHTHSLLSDGASTPQELLSYGRDVAGLDFLALSDHGEYVGHDDGRWQTLNRLVHSASVPGRFVAIPGYETTFAMGWSAHFNVYFAGPDGRPYMAPHGGKAWIPNLTTLDPLALLERLAADGEDTLVIRHHYWSTPRYWRESPPDSDILPMTEICSVHGIWTGDRDVDNYKSDRSAEIRGHAGTMRGGLADGRMFAVGGGSDTHYAFPSDSAAVAVLLPRNDDGVTLDAANIFDAIRARRTYATTGARIGLAFSIDGEPMGSALDAEALPRIAAQVDGTDVVEEFALFENDQIIHRADLDGGAWAELTWSPDAPPPDGTYYQVRVRQADGELAWSTPIWIRPRPPTIADDTVFADRERMGLLIYSAMLRAWPDLATPELSGRTPRAALADPQLAEKARALWPHWIEAAELINARAVEQELVDRAEAARVIKAYGWRFGPLPPPMKVEAIVDPLVDIDAMRQQLGL